jgi:MarR family transcriptional regulator, transcriptional regulator for hemolysin
VDEPCSQAALAARLGIDRTVMTYLLDDLVTAGLVERRQDPGDRRTRSVAATEHGRAIHGTRLSEFPSLSLARAR